MATIAPAYETVNPNYTEPGLLLPYAQASGFASLLATEDLLPRLDNESVVAYIKRVDVRTKMAAGQQSYNSLPSCDVVMSMIGTPSYLLQVRAEYNHHDTAAAANWGVSIVEAQRLAMRQGHNQLIRTASLFGMNPANGEGIVNAVGITSTNLPADPFGNDTVESYDNGAMAFYILSQILAIKTRTNQLGIPRFFTICGPQRTLGSFEYNVVQLVQYQREGAGTASTAGTVKGVAGDNKDTILWVYDDTLQGAGSGGSDYDLVIIDMPEVAKPMANARFNTNVFAELAPGLEACVLQYSDMAAPREIPTPLAGGAIDVLSEIRITSGWMVRPEAGVVITMQYS
jgi:hypothetical protein